MTKFQWNTVLALVKIVMAIVKEEEDFKSVEARVKFGKEFIILEEVIKREIE